VNIVEIKEQAIAYLKQQKSKRKVPQLAQALSFDPSWAYKVIGGSINPSLERCCKILDYKNNIQELDAA
jgi:hypothetical protein